MRNNKHSIAWSVALLTVLGLVLLTQAAQAQTFHVIHNFTGGADGGSPLAGLTMDTAGNVYGTTWGGGYSGGACIGFLGCGTVFKLAPQELPAGFSPRSTPFVETTMGPFLKPE